VRVERLRANFDIAIQVTQFPLHPDTPHEGLTLEQLFAGRNIDLEAAQVRMKRLMADEGLEYGERNMTFNSRLAQELAKWAEAQAGGGAIHAALYRAYFVNGLNIAQPENLVSVIREMGFDEFQARQVLDSRQLRDAVDADWQRSRELGITGVPTYVVGQRTVVGAQPYHVLEQLVRAEQGLRG